MARRHRKGRKGPTAPSEPTASASPEEQAPDAAESPDAAASPKPEPSTTWIVARTVLLMGLFYGVFYYPYDSQGWIGQRLETYLEWQAAASGWLLSWWDPSVRVRGVLIQGSFAVRIVRTCSSLDAQALFAAAVLGYPGRWWLKGVGLLVGLVVVNAVNIIRIATLYVVGAAAPARFDVAHEEVMPIFVVGTAALAFWLWLRWNQPPESAHA